MKTKALLFALFIFVSPAFAGIEYVATDLGNLGRIRTTPVSLNNLGQVVGFSNDSSNKTQAFIWQNGLMTKIPIDITHSESLAYGINDSGQVVGYVVPSPEPARAYLWQQGVGTIDIGTFIRPVDTYESMAQGINNVGQVIGTFQRNGPYNGFLWQQGLDMTYFGENTITRDVNDSGQVVGWFGTGGGNGRPFLWQQGSGMQDLGTLEGAYVNSEAVGINDSGMVIGRCDNGSGIRHSFLWRQDRDMLDLGTLGGKSTTAYGINDSGQVIGGSAIGTGTYHGFLWDINNGMVDINTLVSMPSGVSLSSLTAINDMGQIIGISPEGSDNSHGWLLTPIPEPATLSLLAFGLLFIRHKR